MSKAFTKTFRVRWSETNALGQLGPDGYLRYVMEAAWDWGTAGGLGRAESDALGIVWVIRETAITLLRPLHAFDEFDFAIWLVQWRRVRGTRCFEFRLRESGEIVAQGVQQVATLDARTLRPARLPEGHIDSFLMENPRVFPLQKFPKFKEQPATPFTIQREVEWRDLDSLEHVNNATYATFAENAAAQALATVGWPPERLKTDGLSVSNRHFHILYQTPAVWGERLSVTAALAVLEPSRGEWHIEMVRAADGAPIVRFVLGWSLVDRITGEDRALPQGLLTALQAYASFAQSGGADG